MPKRLTALGFAFRRFAVPGRVGARVFGLHIGCRYSTPVLERPLHPTRSQFKPQPSQTQAPVTPATEPERRAGGGLTTVSTTTTSSRLGWHSIGDPTPLPHCAWPRPRQNRPPVVGQHQQRLREPDGGCLTAGNGHTWSGRPDVGPSWNSKPAPSPAPVHARGFLSMKFSPE